ncbi:MAG: DUF4124 domain-containing protein [Gammaproteobacteria bacterium]|jgi:hypothetical protein|nr:DUF4124 domain-containing protein [Gammaproteobacteria bacterium]MDH3751157.1 DUF4124 domain-containing protein [Gammaproteobacteria bacterium]MDH3804867.1 DUF4124 domain-containing protein [Gammaproteobacteria bacterium]
MKHVLAICVAVMGVSLSAHADVWQWVDADGKTHFVDTMTPIYTWTDEFGNFYYSDTPDHEDAVSVEFVWHSAGSMQDLSITEDEAGLDDNAFPGETDEERAVREQAEAYYCERATEIYESYANAPQLYRTREDGEREYLSKQEADRTIGETRARRDELCG